MWILRTQTFFNEQGMHLNAEGAQFHVVCNKLKKITDVCCGIKNASAKMMTKAFVKQKLQYCERIDQLQDQLLPIRWHCRRRDEPWQQPQPQQPTFHNCRSGQWQVMYYEDSHFTFWNEFSIEKKNIQLYQALWSSYEGILKNDKQLNVRTWKKAKYLILSKQTTHTFY